MLIGLFSDRDAGGTFLTWSLHFLAGDKDYFYAKDNTFLNLVSNPVTDINAHNFKPNTDILSSEFVKIFDALKNSNTNSFNVLYLQRFKTIPLVLDDVCNETKVMVDAIQNFTDKNIVLETTGKNLLFYSKYNGRVLSTKFNSLEHNKNFDEQFEDFINTFYSKSKKVWEDLKLTDIWDKREFLALNLRPYHFLSILPNVDLTKKNFRLSSFELINFFDQTVFDLFAFLNLSIDNERFHQWVPVYKKWQTLHLERILFVEYFDTIIECIINNRYFDLNRFNLDIVQEAIVQHVLMYKHGLTFKTWQLTKFPNNTQDLHKLLEPNVYHKVEKIY